MWLNSSQLAGVFVFLICFNLFLISCLNSIPILNCSECWKVPKNLFQNNPIRGGKGVGDYRWTLKAVSWQFLKLNDGDIRVDYTLFSTFIYDYIFHTKKTEHTQLTQHINFSELESFSQFRAKIKNKGVALYRMFSVLLETTSFPQNIYNCIHLCLVSSFG